MKFEKPPVSRVLEALSPALAAELDRLVTQMQEQFESSFEERLRTAVEGAEVAAHEAAEARLKEAVAEARDAVRRQVTEELQSRFGQTLEQTTKGLKEEFHTALQSAFDAWAVERREIERERDRWRIFAEIQQQLAEAGSQAEILLRFLNSTGPFGASIALYVAKVDGLGLWRSRGKAAFPQLVSENTIDPEFYFRPIAVRNKVVAAVCAAPPFEAAPLDFLSGCLQRAVETFGLKVQAAPPDLSAAAAARARTRTPEVPDAPVAVVARVP